MKQTDGKKFISIRARLFLQVGAVILFAIIIILILNNSLLPEIYTQNEKKSMKSVYEEVNGLSFEDAAFSEKISLLEKEYSFSIDIFLDDGTPFYSGSNDMFAAGGKITVSNKQTFEDGSYFEIQTNSKENTDYIVFGAKLSGGGEIEMFSKKATVDATADIAILITSATSVTALLAALIFIYFYTGKFTKPLIEMSSVTEKMSEMDFSHKCSVKGNDEISLLADGINNLSDSLCATLDDLSEKNERLREDIEKEKNLEKIRKDFISNVSHELKTPISIIRGYSEGAGLMLESGDTDGAKGYCDIIVSETDKMNLLVLQLLELSMYESGSVNIKEEKFNIHEMIDDYANNNEIKMSQKGIHFENLIPESLFGSGDTIKIEMIVNNYIQNAVSHVSGEKLIKVSAEETNDGSYRVCVFNTGSSVADEDIDKIWISFYRADKSRSRSEGRYGLGLSIVSAIQKLHNQQYGVFNTDDGVCFWFDIKKAQND